MIQVWDQSDAGFIWADIYSKLNIIALDEIRQLLTLSLSLNSSPRSLRLKEISIYFSVTKLASCPEISQIYCLDAIFINVILEAL